MSVVSVGNKCNLTQHGKTHQVNVMFGPGKVHFGVLVHHCLVLNGHEEAF